MQGGRVGDGVLVAVHSGGCSQEEVKEAKGTALFLRHGLIVLLCMEGGVYKVSGLQAQGGWRKAGCVYSR